MSAMKKKQKTKNIFFATIPP